MRALVTGGAKRLGREISVYLANRGYDVAIHYNSSENEALDVAKEINSQGRLSECLKCDLLIEDQVKALVPLASEALGGPISMLVNNASIFENDKFIITTIDEITLMISLDGLIDTESERSRLNKELTNINNEIEIISKRLNNPMFVDKAPSKVVVEVKNKKKVFDKRKVEIEKALKNL